MAWDNDKSTAADPDNPQADEQLTADEWDNHVSEGHFPSDELNFGVDGNGDPVITDPQNGGQTVMRYDRSAGSWVVDALEADKTTINGVPFQKLESKSTPSTNKIQFSGLLSQREYAIRVGFYGEDADLEMSFNDDTSTDAYRYWDESGTKQTADQVTLVDVNDFARIWGWLLFGGAPKGPSGQGVGFHSNLKIGRPENTNGYAQKGGITGTPPLDSLELFTGDGQDIQGEWELWEVIQ